MTGGRSLTRDEQRIVAEAQRRALMVRGQMLLAAYGEKTVVDIRAEGIQRFAEGLQVMDMVAQTPLSRGAQRLLGKAMELQAQEMYRDIGAVAQGATYNVAYVSTRSLWTEPSPEEPEEPGFFGRFLGGGRR